MPSARFRNHALECAFGANRTGGTKVLATPVRARLRSRRRKTSTSRSAGRSGSSTPAIRSDPVTRRPLALFCEAARLRGPSAVKLFDRHPALEPLPVEPRCVDSIRCRDRGPRRCRRDGGKRRQRRFFERANVCLGSHEADAQQQRRHQREKTDQTRGRALHTDAESKSRTNSLGCAAIAGKPWLLHRGDAPVVLCPNHAGSFKCHEWRTRTPHTARSCGASPAV